MSLVFTSHYSKNRFRDEPPSLAECIERLNVDVGDVRTYPFVGQDVTAGSENELQVAVAGKGCDVDLPCTIRESRYYANIKRRVGTGDTSSVTLEQLNSYLNDNDDGIWENSWVRFPCNRLNRYAQQVLKSDLQADKMNPTGPVRDDIERFSLEVKGEAWFRLPISYLLKLALADVAGRENGSIIRTTATRLMAHFVSDNTSPETTSFHVISSPATGGVGAGIAREAGK